MTIEVHVANKNLLSNLILAASQTGFMNIRAKCSELTHKYKERGLFLFVGGEKHYNIRQYPWFQNPCMIPKYHARQKYSTLADVS